MADETKGTVESKSQGQDAEDTELRQELEADGELYDDAGKPLPWNHPKRIRRVYKDAKEGRKTKAALEELGVKSVNELRPILAEYNDFKAAYQEWQERRSEGETTEEEDDEAKAAKRQADKLKAALKKLGVKFKEEDDEDEPKREQARANQIITAARDRLVELVEEAGYDLEKMEPKERTKLLRHIDYLVGTEIEEDEEALAAFRSGSLRPVDKYTKKVLKEQFGKAPRTPNVKNPPPRISSGPPGSSERKPDNKVPANTKEATDQMVAELRARRLAKSEE